MKKTIFILVILSISLTSCNEKIGTIDSKAVKSITDICTHNDGVKSIYLRAGNYKATCSNDATFSNQEDTSPTKHNATVSGKEVISCNELCEKNNTLEKITSSRDCSKYGSGRYARCNQWVDKVTCYCSNKVSKVFLRDLTEADL